jgi:hypothetical protein
MTEIGTAAARGKAAPPEVFAKIDDAAAKAPLDPEPFLVRGVQQQVAGNTAVAIEAFERAERRDPRSLPARFFLADLLYRRGDTRRALQEIGVLARLAPDGIQTVAPYIAVYARDRGNWPDLRLLFHSNPNLADAALTALAADPTNADTVLALADGTRSMADSRWAPTLINTLVAAGQYAKARAIWAQASHISLPAMDGLYDPGFTDARSRPPFNWDLVSSSVGLAERQPGGRLHVIFYGHEDGVLAKQLMVLSPGSYRLSLAVAGDASRSHALSWSIRCDKGGTPFGTSALDMVASQGWTFTVPADCPAQWIQLSGISGEASQQSEFTLSNLRLVREHPSA